MSEHYNTPPREVRTADELDELPTGCVIIDSGGTAWQSQRRINGKPAWFQSSTSGEFLLSSQLAEGYHIPGLLVWGPA